MSDAGPSRVRPTALSRRSRHASPSNISEIEEVEENIDIEEEVSDELRGPFRVILMTFLSYEASNHI